jgi:cell division topological specificity factor
VSLLDILFKKRPSAPIAKERLSFILAHERAARSGKGDIVSALKEELIAVICKYTSIDKEALKVTLERHDSIDVLKVDVALPEGGLRRG